MAYTPGLNFPFGMKPVPSTLLNQVVANITWLYELIVNGVKEGVGGFGVYNSDRLGGVAASAYMRKDGTITGELTLNVDSRDHGEYSPYIVHNLGTKYPTVQFYSPGNQAFPMSNPVAIEFTDANRLRFYHPPLSVDDSPHSQTFRYVIR